MSTMPLVAPSLEAIRSAQLRVSGIAARTPLVRYHGALAKENWASDVRLVSKRFRANHRISVDSSLMPALGLIFAAHESRVTGLSSPAEADQVALTLTGGKP